VHSDTVDSVGAGVVKLELSRACEPRHVQQHNQRPGI
jgi:hypothetical protein